MTRSLPLSYPLAHIIAPQRLSEAVRTLARPLVFTNGVFDILHRGHITYLRQARALGASLVVALNSDTSVKRLGKGDDRPINALDDRLELIAALACVSLVTWFEDDTPLSLIHDTKPDVLVKGGDWPTAKIVGADFVQQQGGHIASIPFEYQRSTTALIQQIRHSHK